MIKSILILLLLSFLSCRENQSPKVERIAVVESSIKDTLIEVESDYLDSVPKFIFKKILDIDFIKERVAVLRKHNIRYVFMADRSKYYSNKIHIQILAENEIRFIPIFNFEYDDQKGELFHADISMETLEDTLILIE